MKNSIVFSLTILISLLVFNQSFAQETMIPFCDNLKVIDANIGKRISFFKTFTDFQQATLSKTDEGYIVSITHKSGGIFQTEKRIIDQSVLDNICYEISTLSPQELYEDESASQEARRRLIASATGFSVGYYSWALPLSLGAEDGKAYAASFLLIGGGGFFIPLVATQNKNITNGMSASYAMGAGLGIAHGFALTSLIHGDEFNEKTFFGLGVALSITESLVGLSLAKRNNYSWGRASIMGSGGFWGLGYGLTISGIILEFNEPRANALSALLVSGAGIWGANYLYGRQTITHGDVTYINTTGFLTSFITSAALESFEISNDRVNATLMLAGASAGLWYGINKTKRYNYTRQQGNLIATGGLAGGLVGAGVGILMDANDKTYLWLTSLGALGGFLVTDALVKVTEDTGIKSASSLKLNLNPIGLVNASGKFNSPNKQRDPRYQNSIINLSYTF
jgi:hypothetical protein